MSFCSGFPFFCYPNCCKGETHSINLIEQSSSPRNSKQFPELQLIRLSSIGNNEDNSFISKVSHQSQKSQKSHQETAIFSLKATLTNDYIPEALILSFSEIEKAPRLELKETKGNLFNNETLFINASGLVSKEEQQLSSGGISFFWCSNSEPNLVSSQGSLKPNGNTLSILSVNSQKSKPVNQNQTKIDYKLNIQYPEKFNNYLFMIYYNQESQSYRLKFHHILRPSINTKTDILIKLTKNPIPIIVSVYVVFGSSKILLKTLGNGILEITIIATKKKTVYSPLTTQIVTIGKGKECTLLFDDNPSLGDIQLSIIYDCFKKQWMLQSNEDSSNNPLQLANWFFGIDSYEISNALNVKIFNTQISIEVV